MTRFERRKTNAKNGFPLQRSNIFNKNPFLSFWYRARPYASISEYEKNHVNRNEHWTSFILLQQLKRPEISLPDLDSRYGSYFYVMAGCYCGTKPSNPRSIEPAVSKELPITFQLTAITRVYIWCQSIGDWGGQATKDHKAKVPKNKLLPRDSMKEAIHFQRAFLGEWQVV